jgi:S-adenosylmethionine hydrolase
MAIITLTTDFGTRDGYVGAVKGVLARLAPTATVLDIAHDVPRGDIAHAAWVVASACLEFPAGTIHVVVVDPGVGGERAAVVVAAHDHWFVGPDNGVFAYLAAGRGWQIDPSLGRGERSVRRTADADAKSERAAPLSATFHGRDVFAPAAAMLATAGPIDFGDEVALAGMLPWGPRPAGQGRVVHVDHYGNVITDLPAAEVRDTVQIAGRRLPILRTYEDVPPNELLAYVGSQRTVEIAVRDGRADRVLDAPRGTPVMPGEPFR